MQLPKPPKPLSDLKQFLEAPYNTATQYELEAFLHFTYNITGEFYQRFLKGDSRRARAEYLYKYIHRHTGKYFCNPIKPSEFLRFCKQEKERKGL